jgi:hypothetical protein
MMSARQWSWGVGGRSFTAQVLLVAFLIGAASGLVCLKVLAQEAGSQTPESQNSEWIGPDGKPLPFQNDEELIEFLRTAEVLELEDIPEGVTDPRKALLEKDGIRVHAIFRDVDIYRAQWTDPKAGPRRNFRDNCVYESAAYRLGRLLGMDNIPPAALRRIKGTEGTLQLWIENSRTEKDRVRLNLQPPNPWRWGMQHQMMQLFDQLVYNDDRHQGNILIDPDWKIWLIDHTRCFRTFSDLRAPQAIRFCERGFWEKLQSLNDEVIREELENLLQSNEIKSLLKRRDKLIEHIQGLIEKRGEGAVLFSFTVAETEQPAETSG